MNINSYFSKIICINLESRSDRWKKCEEEFVKNGIKVERFLAQNAYYLPENRYITKNEFGCFFSHIEVIKYAKKEQLKSILIFEDDVEFVEHFNLLFERMIKNVPDDWAMLYLGANHIETPILISKNIVKITKSYTTHAYALRNNIYDIILNHPKLFQMPLDIFYANYIHPNFNCYCFYPHIAYQRNDFSDIQNKNVNYDFIKNYQLPITFNYILKRPSDAIRRIIKKFKDQFY